MDEQVPTVGTISWNSIVDKKVPTVLKGQLRKWTCAKWSMEDWASKCGDILFQFRSGSKSNLNHWETQHTYTKAKLKDFVSWLRTNSEELKEDHPLKSFDSSISWCYSSYNYMAKVFNNIPEMLDVVDWSYLGLEDRGGFDSTLWIGSQGSNTPCHQDTYGNNLVAQLIGEKLWILYPPESSDFLYPTRVPYEESSVYSSVNILHPDLTTFPRFSNTAPYIVVLRPGDVLYVPPKWWHFVYCLDTAVSINTWVEHESDDASRLEEAIVRFMMTAFITTYQNDNQVWLNPTEEILSAEETTELLNIAVQRAKAVAPLNKSKDSEDVAADNMSSVMTELKSISYDEFEQEMKVRTCYKRIDGYYRQNYLMSAVNTMLSGSVLNAIASNLIQNLKDE